MTLLLLAGTAEARALAHGLSERGIPAVASLAGATRAPAALPLPTHIGGFGGDAGFRRYLRENGVGAVVDATHPFAARMTERTHAVCDRDGVPLLRLERPGWSPGPLDRWTMVDDAEQAAGLIPPDARVLLATGRQTLEAWAGLSANCVHMRVIDPPAEAFPLRGGWIVGRPPFDLASEMALLWRLAITHLVAKDSGGADGRAKLDAARALGIAVILLRRPVPPAGLRVVGDVATALAWAAAPSARRRSVAALPRADRGTA